MIGVYAPPEPKKVRTELEILTTPEKSEPKVDLLEQYTKRVERPLVYNHTGYLLQQGKICPSD
jgi:hypothetical protein